MVRNGVSLQDIGTQFNVSRERARQWRDAFGEFEQTIHYTLQKDVKARIGVGTAIAVSKPEE